MEISYQGSKVWLGTYDTQDRAALANKVARSKLKVGPKRPPNQIKEEIRLARVAVTAALATFKDPSKEGKSTALKPCPSTLEPCPIKAKALRVELQSGSDHSPQSGIQAAVSPAIGDTPIANAGETE